MLAADEPTPAAEACRYAARTMHQPLEVVFRDCTADDVISKLVGIGCEVERIDERGFFDPRIDPASNMVTQSISLSLNGVEPFGGRLSGPFLAWEDNSSACRPVYMPHRGPCTLRDLAAIPLSPIMGIVDLFCGLHDTVVSAEQSARDEAGATILESLESDPVFVRHSFISMDGFKTARNAG